MASSSRSKTSRKRASSIILVSKEKRARLPQQQWPRMQTVPFLDLPTEIRVKIYSLLFHGAKLTIVDPGICLNESSASGAEILQTNKTIYQEGMPVLYGHTTLRYAGLEKGPTSVFLIPAYRKLIKNMIIDDTYSTALPLTPSSLRSYKSLQTLSINMGNLHSGIFSGLSRSEIMDFPSPRDGLLLERIKDFIEEAQRKELFNSWERRQGPVQIGHLQRLAKHQLKQHQFRVLISFSAHRYLLPPDFICPQNFRLTIIVDWTTDMIISKVQHPASL